jgi:hypothetical protein
MAEIREYNRLAQQRSREKRKLLNAVNDNVNDKTLTSQECQGTEEDKERELRDKNKDIKKKKSSFDSILSEISDDELRNLYYEFIDMRKTIKSPITSDRALNMLINKVNELEPKDIGRQKKMLENAIVNNWKSVYPLKEEPKKEIKTDASYDIEAFRRQGLCGELKYERKKK